MCLIYLVIHKTCFCLNESDFPAVNFFVEARESNAAFIFKVQIMVGVRSNRRVVLHCSRVLAAGKHAGVTTAHCLHTKREKAASLTGVTSCQTRPIVTTAVCMHAHIRLGDVTLTI